MATAVETNQAIRPIAGGITAPKGFVAAGVHAGIKRQKKDIALVFSERPCSAAATFTTNRVKAAPLLVTKEHVQAGSVRAIVVNSGNANACTGEQGLADARRMAAICAEKLGIRPEEVVVASTGVIGVFLPMEKIEAGIAQAAAALSVSGAHDAALGIMTTDTRPKEVAVVCECDGVQFRIGAMAKGSGMIHPNMATMLAFITTDAAVEREFLQERLKAAVDVSFNMITVDGDTSTNDMAVVLANGAAPGAAIKPGTPIAEVFSEALTRVCIELAKMIAADGEGATKLIEVRVKGAKSAHDARLAVKAVAGSSLVKTAVYGEDANWGRILCAVGYSGADFDPETTTVYLGNVKVFEHGMGVPFDEHEAKSVLAAEEVAILIDLGEGEGEATGWTCDLTYDYVKINASYRT